MESSKYKSKASDQNGIVHWTSEENETWQTLIQRQSLIIKGRASREFFNGLDILNFHEDRIPQIPDINKILGGINGWGVSPVPALIQPDEFYGLMATKKFPAATFIRTPKDLDYIEEPDIFHEIYGHTPLLTCPATATFMYEFGKLALNADKKYRRKLFRLFWFTIEFGMIKEESGDKAFGAGILSSIGETEYCSSNMCVKRPFNVMDVLRTPYRIDIMQPLYYVLNRVEDLLDLLELDLFLLIEKSAELGDYDPLFDLEGKTLDTETGRMGN